MFLLVFMHLSMLSPRGGGPRAYVGHLTSIAFPTLGNLTKNLGPGWGRYTFLHGGMGPSQIVPCARLCRHWFPFRKWSMPFLTIDEIIGNQAFQNGKCYICFSLGLDKLEAGYNVLMELKCTHQMLNFSYAHWFACGWWLLFAVWGNSIINI